MTTLENFPEYRPGMELPEDHVVYRGRVMEIDDMLAFEERFYNECLSSME